MENLWKPYGKPMETYGKPVESLSKTYRNLWAWLERFRISVRIFSEALELKKSFEKVFREFRSPTPEAPGARKPMVSAQLSELLGRERHGASAA